MAFFDLPLEQLQVYRPTLTEPADFDLFWQQSLQETRQFPLAADFKPYESGLETVEIYDVTYGGYAGQPIKGWLLLPRQRSAPLPCVVEYVGYGGGRGLPFERLLWSAAGYAHFIMDTRGQGSAWCVGDTPDLVGGADNPQYPGFMTRGILNPETYYYRRVFMDAVRAVEAARSHPAVDPHRIALTGGSQGGGITLAAGALADHIQAILPDVPFLCHYRVATQLTDSAPYSEISAYLKTQRNQVERVFQTLAYFDGVYFAVRSQAKALFSVALMDDICPPRTVFAAYNHYQGQKQIKIWEYNRHEGGQAFHDAEKLAFLKHLWH